MIMPESLVGIKAFLKTAKLPAKVQAYVIRLVTAFVVHVGRMSASQAGGSVKSEARHRAQVARFLADCRWSPNWVQCLWQATLLLEVEKKRAGRWLFIVDQTYCGQQGQKTENTFSRANYRPRTNEKPRRHKKKHARRSCHCFVMGLLLTPGGLRLPVCKSYYTETHCEAKKVRYRKQAELAAELIRELAVPASASVVVLGDTAFDAAVIHQVCAERNFIWIVPVNPERVLERAKPRPKIVSLADGFSAGQFAPVRLVPHQGAFAAQRRVARCRIGPKAKTRTFYVHKERQEVHSVGRVLLVFSTTNQPERGKKVPVQKILMTNALDLPAALVVELYDLRWQIELFFKELKSTLGMHHYRFQKFAAAENWIRLCLLTFWYLEWYRARKLRRRDLTKKDKEWWRWQRSYGLCRAVRQEAENKELEHLARWTRTRTGLKKLKKCLRAAHPLEYRQPAKTPGFSKSA
jgi:Transposase DDE domain